MSASKKGGNMVVFVTDRPDIYTASGAIQATDVLALTYRLHRYEFMHEHSPIGIVLGGETASTFSGARADIPCTVSAETDRKDAN